MSTSHRGVGLALLALSCSNTHRGYEPAGTTPSSEPALKRFVRRLTIDFLGRTPTDDELAYGVDRLFERNTVGSRAELADEVVSQEEFAQAYFQAAKARIWLSEPGSQPIEDAYATTCQEERIYQCKCDPVKDFAQACEADCGCKRLTELRAERDQLLATPADLAAGKIGTVAVDERLALAAPAYLFFDADSLVQALFEGLLMRDPNPDEQRNAAQMVTGSPLGPDRAAGVLFHRVGSNQQDLFDIVFASHTYAEAVVVHAFSTLLGRDPSAFELIHFAKWVEQEGGDARSLWRTMASSREYFGD